LCAADSQVDVEQQQVLAAEQAQQLQHDRQQLSDFEQSVSGSRETLKHLEAKLSDRSREMTHWHQVVADFAGKINAMVSLVVLFSSRQKIRCWSVIQIALRPCSSKMKLLLLLTC
jgi:hypothetical protein